MAQDVGEAPGNQERTFVDPVAALGPRYLLYVASSKPSPPNTNAVQLRVVTEYRSNSGLDTNQTEAVLYSLPIRASNAEILASPRAAIESIHTIACL